MAGSISQVACPDCGSTQLTMRSVNFVDVSGLDAEGQLVTGTDTDGEDSFLCDGCGRELGLHELVKVGPSSQASS